MDSRLRTRISDRTMGAQARLMDAVSQAEAAVKDLRGALADVRRANQHVYALPATRYALTPAGEQAFRRNR